MSYFDSGWFWTIVDVNGVIIGQGQAHDQEKAAEQVRACLAYTPLAHSGGPSAQHRLTFQRLS